ncbi:MAG: hypothetical protein MR687_00185 [Spirochaetales bacterium]|nr:hypothetical protein [Spirochaetales bacterium]MDD6841871.1 hypothetical protein [Spirochaetales bacterium]
MKRLYSISIVIILVSIIFSSCQTEKDYSTLSSAEGLKGMEAAEVYSTFLSQNEDERVRWNYVYSLFEANEYDKALTEVEKGISLYPHNIRFLYLKSLIYRNTQQEEKEKEALESVREKNPGNLDARARLVSLYDSLGYKEKATEEAKAILLYDGKNLSAIEYLSYDSEFYALLYSTLKPKEEPSSPETEEEESNNTDTL